MSDNKRDHSIKVIDDDDKKIHFNKEYESNQDNHIIHTSPQDNSNNSPNKNMSSPGQIENSNNKKQNDKINQVKGHEIDYVEVDENEESEVEEEQHPPEPPKVQTYFYDNYVERLKEEEKEAELARKNKIERPKSFATKKYKGHIDPVKLRQQYNNFWKNTKKKNKTKKKDLNRVFFPEKYKNDKKKNKGSNYNGYEESEYSEYSEYTDNIIDFNQPKVPFDNSTRPLPKKSYLYHPYDYGLNDPKYGIEDPAAYNRMKMCKLHMIKQPLKYYFPYTNDFKKYNK